jgi:transposase
VNIDWGKVRIYLKPGPTDMRKQMHSLAVYVAEELKHDALSGDMYIFCSRDRKLVKVMYWDRNGFCMWQKRLAKESFPWPKDGDEVRTISREQFNMLLDGIDFFRAHKTLHFSFVS